MDRRSHRKSSWHRATSATLVCAAVVGLVGQAGAEDRAEDRAEGARCIGNIRSGDASFCIVDPFQPVFSTLEFKLQLGPSVTVGGDDAFQASVHPGFFVAHPVQANGSRTWFTAFVGDLSVGYTGRTFLATPAARSTSTRSR